MIFVLISMIFTSNEEEGKERRCMVRSKNFFMKFYLALIIAFLYIPIAVLVVLSFNDSRSRVVWGGFTLEWYKTLFHNSDVVAALQNTLTIGLALR